MPNTPKRPTVRPQSKGSGSSSSSSRRQWLGAVGLVATIMIVLSRTQNIDTLMEQSSQTSSKDATPTTGSSSPGVSDESAATKNPIRQISILGERNSGTRWTFE